MANAFLRPLTTADGPVLAQATLDSLNWSEHRVTEHDVDNRPEFRHYTQVMFERGDFGCVAERTGEIVGVAWALFLPATDPGYGYLNDSTPEVCLWARKDSRAIGVGRLLLWQLQQETIDRGVGRLTLSVEAGNNARRLYESEGFTPVRGRADDGIMTWSS